MSAQTTTATIQQLQAEVIEEAALLIEKYSVEMANCWRNKPFNRVTLARSFAMASLGDNDPGNTDPHPHVLLISEIAYADRTRRLSAFQHTTTVNSESEASA